MSNKTDRENAVKSNPGIFKNQIPSEYRSILFLDHNETHYEYKQYLNLDFSVLVPKSEVYRGKETTFVSQKWQNILTEKWKKWSYNKGS